jgi:hypothetical protein
MGVSLNNLRVACLAALPDTQIRCSSAPPQDFEAPPGALPPLLVKIHGGPTSQASSAFNLGVQYWTSRGGWGRMLGRAGHPATWTIGRGGGG